MQDVNEECLVDNPQAKNIEIEAECKDFDLLYNSELTVDDLPDHCDSS